MTPSDQQRTPRKDEVPYGQSQRLETLRDLVLRRAYSVPSEDVAARIIGHALGGPAPARHGHS
jgi:hypothetical protein